ncbi:MAG: hypothetical protein EON87_00845 [Brevundimonas sp.]|nr:MAG: hypothetical protein EON87_00845 [Brevundimonas sp.]
MAEQAFSDFAPKLSGIEGLTLAANKGLYFTGPETPAVYDLTSFGRSIAGAADGAAGRTALGLDALLAAKAPLANPTFTGSAAGPTPAIGDNDTSLATTAFVRLERSDLTAPTILRDEFAVASTESGEIGEMGWSFTAGTWNLIPPEASHPGICRRASTAVSGTVASCYLGGGGTATILRWDQTEEQTWIVRPLTTDADYDVRVGVFSDGTANPPSNGVYFERLAADTSWFGVTRASASQTRSAALASFAGDWFKLRIRRIDASTVGFTINGGTEVTQTGNVFGGTTALVIGMQIIPTSTNARSVDVDAFCHVIPAMAR